MSANGQIHSPGSSDWVEQLRETLRHEPPPSDEAILEAAYEASEIDTATLFDYCEGRLSQEERQEVEAEVMACPHTLKKLARIGAIVAESRDGALAAPNRVASPQRRNLNYQAPPSSESSSVPAEVKPPSQVFRMKLPQPRPALGNAQPRREDCLCLSPEGNCEVFRSLEKERDQLRLYHQSAPCGTLLKVKLLELHSPGASSAERFTQFLVLRRGSESSTATTLTIPLSFKRGEVELELTPISHHELCAEDATNLLRSFERASQDDPISVTPLHEPRSAWQQWADAILSMPPAKLPQPIREVAELIASS